jgi:hypothetical protein
MKLKDLSENWPKLIAILLLTAFLFWGWGCPSRVPSLLDKQKQVTRPELQVELDQIIATAEFRLADLDRQDRFRDLIFNNAMLMVEGGTLNPVGILTGLAALYGITRGGSDVVKRVKKRKENTT